VIPLHYTEGELAHVVQDLPENPHKRFIDRSNDVYSNGSRVVGFLGKEKTKYFWAVRCFCGNIFKAYRPDRNCGCVSRTMHKERMKGNNLGILNRNTNLTIERLKDVKPTYDVISHNDGGVMDKWDFVCSVCELKFSCRPDNLLGKRGTSDTGQTPCLCREPVYGGYKKSKTGILYILRYSSYCKFGITGDLDMRKRNLDNAHGENSSIEFFMYLDGDRVYKIEQLLKSLDIKKYNPGNIGGWTECRTLDSLETLVRVALGTVGDEL
jgi:hypothetical protein